MYFITNATRLFSLEASFFILEVELGVELESNRVHAVGFVCVTPAFS